MNRNTTPTEQIAKSTAAYRCVEIRETKEGATVIMGTGKQYDFKSLEAATAWIDRMYADAARRAGMATRQ